MATYYVRSGGSDGNTGLGAGTGQAWATIGKALGATGITGGDTVYIAPGTYRETVTIGGTYSSSTFIYGDPTASLFSGVTAGEVRITPSGSDNAVSTSYALTATTKNNLNLKDLVIGGMNITNSSNMTIERCLLFSTSATTQAFLFVNTNTTNYNTTIKQSVITGTVAGIEYRYGNSISAYTAGLYVSDCFITGLNAVYLNNNFGFSPFPAGTLLFYNCVMVGYIPYYLANNFNASVTNNNIGIFNSLIYATGTYAFQVTQPLGVTENFNRIYGVNTRQNVTQGANTTVASWPGLEFGQSLLQGFGPIQIFGNTFNSPNATAGTASGAPLVDMYNQNWNVTPDIGVAIYRNIGGVGQYLPGERNASAIITPASTSQSIELYLGVTGLTATTAGLNARYNRTRSASVSIPLVARTITQAWVAGGFAEVDSVNMPGLYRLDLPDAAVASGADDVTVVVRGATGTNGAVVTIKLLAILANANTALRSAVITDLSEDIDTPNLIYQTVGDRKPLCFRLFNADGSNPDLAVAGGTVVGIVHNAYSGVEYTFGVGGYAGMTVNILSDMIGFVEVVPPAIWGTSGMYRLKVRYTLPTGVRIYGPVNIRVGAL